MGRAFYLLYWAFCCLSFLAAFVYLVGFVGNRYSFSTIDSGLQLPWRDALLVDCALLLLFFAQHSAMARAGFKRLWRRLLPVETERPTYLLATSLVLALIYARWEPMPEMVWQWERPGVAALVHVLFWTGWGLAAVSVAVIGCRELFGWNQLWQRSYQPPRFHQPGPYRWVRHPMMLGLLTAFWATPEMSRGHLLFAAANTAYVLAALRWEERDLARAHGPEYEAWRRTVPRLLPFRRTGEGRRQ
jgi:protein-S-isoprenylcysteine O-methyltransferase Ste14